MTQSCTACGRTNTLQRAACIYCGEPLSGVGSDGVGTSDGPVMPEDLDALVRQAMTLGTTAHLERAFAAQSEAQQAEAVPDVDLPTTGELLQRLVDAATAAASAEAEGEDARLATALADAREILAVLPAVRPPQEVLPPAPVVLLPKVRRPFALVVEGMGSVEAHPAFVEHLCLDAVTSRMLARARHPRVAIRGDDEHELEQRAAALVRETQIQAIVVSPADLLGTGPARLLTSFETGPATIEVHDWTADLHALIERSISEPLGEVPKLIVPGELVLQRYRPASGGGRLKHLREGRLDAGRQVRLQVVDLHMEDFIVRILEGVTDLAHAPGASEEGFHRTLMQMLEGWESEGHTVLNSRTLEPSTPEGQPDELGGVLAHPWPQWEEHSRCSRLLYFAE